MSLLLDGTLGVPVTTVTGTLPVANGGTGVTASKQLVQNLNYTTGAVATGTTTIPEDDTIPQITEGDQYMSLAITPTNASNKLVIDVIVNLSINAATTLSSVLFQDATVNALAAMSGYMASSTAPINLCFRYVMAAGTTSSTTFRVRCGGASAGTTTFNGRGSGRIFGGVMASSITIKEYTA